jgi:eukaryotic-like serine/threonine-protein kinase
LSSLDLTPERWSQISEIAADFLERVDQSDTALDAFLKEHCGDDQALREQVASLLAADKKGRAVLGRASMANAVGVALQHQASRASTQWIGRTLGNYRIESEIARGGMGAVYRAVRSDTEFEKQVAIKIVGDVAGRPSVQERFRAERQILASLEHPNIAHLIDGGTTEEGLPYLVMEYVDGEPITTYCATKKLDVTERLELFRSICGAVHFAHQRLVVHRDLKPTNIFVTHAGEKALQARP